MADRMLKKPLEQRIVFLFNCCVFSRSCSSSDECEDKLRGGQCVGNRDTQVTLPRDLLVNIRSFGIRVEHGSSFPDWLDIFERDNTLQILSILLFAIGYYCFLYYNCNSIVTNVITVATMDQSKLD